MKAKAEWDLSNEEQVSLGRRYVAGEKNLSEALILSQVSSINRLAKNIGTKASDIDDLEGVGFLAVTALVDSYDPERGSFSGYCYMHVWGDMLDYIRENKQDIRFCARSYDKQGFFDDKPNSMATGRYIEARNETVPVTRDQCQVDQQIDFEGIVTSAMEHFGPRNRQILEMNYSGFSNVEIGRKFNLSGMQVGRIVNKFREVILNDPRLGEAL